MAQLKGSITDLTAPLKLKKSQFIFYLFNPNQNQIVNLTINHFTKGCIVELSAWHMTDTSVFLRMKEAA